MDPPSHYYAAHLALVSQALASNPVDLHGALHALSAIETLADKWRHPEVNLLSQVHVVSLKPQLPLRRGSCRSSSSVHSFLRSHGQKSFPSSTLSKLHWVFPSPSPNLTSNPNLKTQLRNPRIRRQP